MNRTFFEALYKQLPALARCKRISLSSGDVLIHAPGFEPRTMGLVDLVAAQDQPRSVLLEYRPFNERNRLTDVMNGLAARGVRATRDDIVLYDRFDPGDFEERLRQRLLLECVNRAIVDISTMSKLEIMLVLNVCRDIDVSVDIFYAEAKHYGPTREEFESAKENGEIHRPSLQVYTGVRGVVRVDSMASVAMQGHPTAALVFMSFNDALTQVLLNTVYPSRLFLINGRPPVHSWREEATAWIHEQVRGEWAEDNPLESSGAGLPSRCVSTLDYREALGLLLDLYWQLSTNHRILLAPAGSKLQAVACYLFKALHPDVQVEYPSPEGFSRFYSDGVGDCWSLSFGRLGRHIDAIEREERLEFLSIAT